MAETYSDTTAMAHEVFKPSSSTPSTFIRIDDANEEDGCSICLEPYVLDDPPSITNCQHEYHLQCIIEWSQRSQDCPVCWRPLALQDPSHQELLVETKPAIRSRSISSSSSSSIHPRTNMQYDEHIQNRYRQATLRLVQRVTIDNPAYMRTSSTTQSQVTESPLIHATRPRNAPQTSRNSERKQGVGTYRTGGAESTRRQSSSGTRSLSSSLKSKLSSTSTKCKESIVKSAHTIKGKFLLKNKEVSRMIERLDIKSKMSFGTPNGTPAHDDSSSRNAAISSKNEGAAIHFGRK